MIVGLRCDNEGGWNINDIGILEFQLTSFKDFYTKTTLIPTTTQASRIEFACSSPWVPSL